MTGRGLWGFLAAGPLAALAFAWAAPEAAAQNPPWWDPAWLYRQQVVVSTGANSPVGTYVGYTAAVTGHDTATLVAAGLMLAGGDDLRVVRWDGLAWTELPRLLVDMNGFATSVRFMLALDIPANTADTSYFFYFGNPAAGAPPAVSPTNIYLWWDDATADREASYIRGRVDDSAHGGTTAPPAGGWLDSVTWNPLGYYDFSTGNDHPDSLRPMVGGLPLVERDVYVEYEFLHTNAWDSDMASGPLARWIGTGTLNTELSTGHYYYQMADSTQMPASPAQHGDITFTNRTTTALEGTGTIPQVPNNAWTRAALACWSAGVTNLRAWFDDTPTPVERGGFGLAPTLSGTHSGTSEVVAGGQAGVWLQQEAGQIRHLLVRRYVDPEPSIGLGGIETPGGPLVPPSSLKENKNGDSGINDRCGGAASGGAGAAGWLALSLAVVAILLARGVRSSPF